MNKGMNKQQIQFKVLHQPFQNKYNFLKPEFAFDFPSNNYNFNIFFPEHATSIMVVNNNFIC